MKRISMLSVVFFSFIFLFNGISYAIPTKRSTNVNDRIKRYVEKQKNLELSSMSGKIITEAVDGVSLTKDAFNFLSANDVENAKKSVNAALKKIDTAIANNKGKEFVPVEVIINTYIGVNDNKSAQKLKSDVEMYVKEGKIQQARGVLMTMIDEIDLETLNLPLGVYRDKLNNVIGLLENDQKWKARESLKDALALLTVNVDVLPLPIIESEAFMDIAIKTEKKDSLEALSLFKDANKYLDLAVTLGYINAEETTIRNKLKVEKKKIYKKKLYEYRDRILSKLETFESKVKKSEDNVYKGIKEQTDHIKSVFSNIK